MRFSESITNIAKALSNVQAEIQNPKNTARNPFYSSSYAPLNDILNDVRPLLSKHGLAVMQAPSGDGDTISVTTLLLHTSGEWIETCPLSLKADKPTAQGGGSAITYARRYALSAVLGISSEDDDDGNHASGEKKGAKTEQATTPSSATGNATTDKPAASTDKISKPQAKRMFALSGGNADIVRSVISEYGYTRSEDIPKAEYEEICGKVTDMAAKYPTDEEMGGAY